MYKALTNLLFILALALAAPLALAEGDGYQELSAAQPTQDPSKVEVIEFFWYGCPHCYAFEPLVASWVKKQAPNVQFIRQPAIFNEQWGKHAKVYFVAEALGVVDKVHSDIFNAVQKNKSDLSDEDSVAKFFAAHGVAEADVRNAYNSFLVDTRMRQAQAMAPRYGVDGVPALIVNGKYLVNSESAKTHEHMLEVVDRLIKEASAAPTKP